MPIGRRCRERPDKGKFACNQDFDCCRDSSTTDRPWPVPASQEQSQAKRKQLTVNASWMHSIQLPAFTAIPGHQTNQARLPTDHPIGVTICITFGSCMPKSVVFGVVQVGLMPARVSELFNLKHNISRNLSSRCAAETDISRSNRKMSGLVHAHSQLIKRSD